MERDLPLLGLLPQKFYLLEEYAPFEKVFLDALTKHAPLKKKVVCANHAPYITKTLRKAIMKWSYLEKVYFKKKIPDSLKKI